MRLPFRFHRSNKSDDEVPLYREFPIFLVSFVKYLFGRFKTICLQFEKFKNYVVDWLLWKRGMLHKPFVHASLLGIAALAVLTGGAFGGRGIVAFSYPGVEEFSMSAKAQETAFESPLESSLEPVTIISDKPRSEIVEYTVKGGETVSTIAENFGVTTETILWENDLSASDSIHPGDTLKILPVSGIAHTVASGDTIYSVAKKYQADAQAILDFPFNDIGDNLSLKVGQTLIVPNGAPEAAPKPRPVQYLAKSNVPSKPLVGSGQFAWPTSGEISQYFSWYHPAIDICNSAAPGIAAADSGKVTIAGWPDWSGYGNRILIDHGNGYQTLYAHLSAIYVSPGQYVSRGQIIGKMGSTGRSTGIHLHFEIMSSGVSQNPLYYLK